MLWYGERNPGGSVCAGQDCPNGGYGVTLLERPLLGSNHPEQVPCGTSEGRVGGDQWDGGFTGAAGAFLSDDRGAEDPSEADDKRIGRRVALGQGDELGVSGENANCLRLNIHFTFAEH